MKKRTKLINSLNVTESNSYKCEDVNLLFKYTKINDSTGFVSPHEIGDTKGGSQEDCIDLCNGAEGCQSIFYSENTQKCHLSSIEVTKAKPGADWKTYVKSCVTGVLIYIIIYVIYIYLGNKV